MDHFMCSREIELSESTGQGPIASVMEERRTI